MPEQSGGRGNTRDPAMGSNNNNNNSNNNNISWRTRNDNRRIAQRNRRFEGSVEALKHSVYDISPISDNFELFNTTTEAIGEYVAREFQDAGEY